LATLVPLSIGGWGVREGAMIALLAPLGVTHETALLFSVALGLAIMLASLPGILWIWRRSPKETALVGRAPLEYSAVSDA